MPRLEGTELPFTVVFSDKEKSYVYIHDKKYNSTLRLVAEINSISVEKLVERLEQGEKFEFEYKKVNK